jgi:hypothetical protein
MKKAIPLLASVILCLIAVERSEGAKVLAISPFLNDSRYKGPWKIEEGFPRLLGIRLKELGGYKVITVEEVKEGIPKGTKPKKTLMNPKIMAKVGEDLGADAIVIGRIKRFSITHRSVGFPEIGGYHTYEVGIEIEVKVLRCDDGTELSAGLAKGSEESGGAEVSLLGGPPIVGTRPLPSFGDLDKMEFGGKEYMKTMIGKATEEAISAMVEVIKKGVPPDIRPKERIEGQVLMVKDGEVYISVGSTDGIMPGDVLFVHEEGEEIRDPKTGEVLGRAENLVGKIEVVVVLAEKLSKAKPLEGDIKPLQIVRGVK